MKTAIYSTPQILFLIGEELKSRKFFNLLQELGLDDSYYQPHLDDPILEGLGLNDDRDDTFHFYSSLMDEHAAIIGPEKESIREQARAVYARLVEKAATI